MPIANSDLADTVGDAHFSSIPADGRLAATFGDETEAQSFRSVSFGLGLVESARLWPQLVCIGMPPNSFGRCFGRKLGVLYDDYVEDVSGSTCTINKMGKEVVLHTQEAWGSSPYAPTTFVFS